MLTYYIDFTNIITDKDEKVLQKIEKLVLNTENYINDNIYFLEDRCIDKDTIDKEELIWILFADVLIENGYAEEFDWKCELEDFEYLFMNLKQFKHKFNRLTLPSLEANDSILEYVNQITLYWKKENVLVANMDIDIDSYILFPLELERLEKLEKLGKDVNKSFITF